MPAAGRRIRHVPSPMRSEGGVVRDPEPRLRVPDVLNLEENRDANRVPTSSGGLLEEQVEGGSSRRAAGHRLQVTAATPVRWAAQEKRTGRAERGPQKRRPRSPLEAYADRLLELAGAGADLTLDQVRACFAEERQVKTRRSAGVRFFHRHGISFRKPCTRPNELWKAEQPTSSLRNATSSRTPARPPKWSAPGPKAEGPAADRPANPGSLGDHHLHRWPSP